MAPHIMPSPMQKMAVYLQPRRAGSTLAQSSPVTAGTQSHGQFI